MEDQTQRFLVDPHTWLRGSPYTWPKKIIHKCPECEGKRCSSCYWTGEEQKNG